MRIAMLSDIHGYITSLDAVLKDIEQQGGVDEYWALGDLVALGPAPVEVLERLSTLPSVKYVRGNTDRYVYSGDRPPPSIEDAKNNPDHLTALVECAGSFAWTLGAITQAGWLDWLSNLPLENRTTLPDGTKVLGIHAKPGCDDGLGIKTGLTDSELAFILGDCNADLIFGGHHHEYLDITTQNRRAINIGSVGLPVPPDIRASYVILNAEASGYQIEHRCVEHERESLIQTLKDLRHPSAKYLVQFLKGTYKTSGRASIEKQLKKLGYKSENE